MLRVSQGLVEILPVGLLLVSQAVAWRKEGSLKYSCRRAVVAAACLLACAELAHAQSFSRAVAKPYRVVPNATYLKSGQWEGKLDIYSRSDRTGSHPTLVFIHGGDSMGGSKETSFFSLLPYLELGWNVVNVEHRLPGVTLAPAALQNSLCALRWIIRNAREYGFDTTRLVISGTSSGGWFAVAVGLGVRPDNWGEVCPGSEEPVVAAIVNWYGNWDLADILQGQNAKTYAPGWVRGLPNPLEVARSLSPLPLRPGIPPVISIHGDADPTVPYMQSVRLHQALKIAGVPEEMITIPGGKHGGFSREENQRAFAAIEEFLKRTVIQQK
jgi:acetyl esterase/lipase